MSIKTTLDNYIKEAYNTAKEKGWHDKVRSFGDLIALCHSELSEALEDYRKEKEYDEIYYKKDKPCGIPVEMADLLIRVFDMCEYFRIPLETALNIKMNYNKTRPYRHGNKVI